MSFLKDLVSRPKGQVYEGAKVWITTGSYPKKIGYKDNSYLDTIFKKDEEDINMKNMCKCKRCYGCEHLEEPVVLNLEVGVLREDEIKTDDELMKEVNKELLNEEEKILFVQAKDHMKEEWIIEEQERLQEITGMKVCILKAGFSYIGIK
ncbi:hypothetical protein REO35_04360 [Clostridium perfringens]|uniref:hypothetical protein n=1 Tax=Clostridium perfringens TaxID=1502 RepID=UPI0028CC257E|nr:hypothetical protein [Clostridium perfringens]MDT7986940.1 hypothetical protein [Clostridium perfringens]